MTNHLPKISLAAPVYNNATKIEAFVEQSSQILSKLTSQYEIILVNDGSTDDTFNKLQMLKNKHKWLRVVNLKQNVGQHIATSIALKLTRGTFIIMMDSDMQIDPSQIQLLYQKGLSEDGWDVVSGFRTKRSANFVRTIGSCVVSLLINKIYGVGYKDIGSTFKLFKRSALEKLLAQDYLLQSIPLLIAYMKLKQIEVSIDYNTDNNKSGYSISTLISTLVLALLNFSTGVKSLVFLFLFGFLSIVLSFTMIVALIGYGIFYQQQLPTNLLIFFIGSGLFGVMMLMLGIIAFKLERVVKNLEFRKMMIRYDDPE